MGARIRWFEPDVVYTGVSRTVDRAFLFVPNHRMDNPMLRYDCEANALSPDNELIPKPSIINIIGSSVGRALKEHPINIHAFEGNINHIHTVYSAGKDNVENIPNFFPLDNGG